MKKVLCIDAGKLPNIISAKSRLIEGNPYTVCESNYCEKTNMTYYWLLELPINRMFSGYASVRFIDCTQDEKMSKKINSELTPTI